VLSSTVYNIEECYPSHRTDRSRQGALSVLPVQTRRSRLATALVSGGSCSGAVPATCALPGLPPGWEYPSPSTTRISGSHSVPRVSRRQPDHRLGPHRVPARAAELLGRRHHRPCLPARPDRALPLTFAPTHTSAKKRYPGLTAPACKQSVGPRRADGRLDPSNTALTADWKQSAKHGRRAANGRREDALQPVGRALVVGRPDVAAQYPSR
jgi:hypothetical protein